MSTDQLAAQLTALSLKTHQNIKFAFEQAMMGTCRSMITIVDLLNTYIISSPTLALRAILGRQDVYGRAGRSAVEIFPCQSLNTDQYRFLPMNISTGCTSYIPLEWKLNGQAHRSYLDPATNIIHKSGLPSDCSLLQDTPVQIGTKLYTYNAHTGHLSTLTKLPELEVYHWESSKAIFSKPTIFHEIVMHSWDEVTAHTSLNDLLSTISTQQAVFQEMGMPSSGSPTEIAKSTISAIATRGLFGFLSGLSTSIWNVWVFICCVYITIGFLILHCLPRKAAGTMAINLSTTCNDIYEWAKTKVSARKERLQERGE